MTAGHDSAPAVVISGDRDLLAVRRAGAYAARYGGAILTVLLPLSIVGVIADRPEGSPVLSEILSEVLVIAALLPLAAIAWAVGVREVRDVRTLDRLQLRITDQGISWGHAPDAPDNNLGWHEIRHVTITGHPPGRRRLQIETARATSGRTPRAPRPWPRWSWLPGSSATSGPRLDLPADRLSLELLEVFEVLSRASRGRFPDRYPPGRFDRPVTSAQTTPSPTAGPERTVIAGDQRGLRGRHLAGTAALYASGALALPLLVACAALLVASPVVLLLDVRVPAAAWNTLRYATSILVVSLVVHGIARRVVDDAKLLRQLRLEIRDDGLRWRSTTETDLSWQGIRHIAITNQHPGRRRLLVDTGRGREPDPRYAMSIIRRSIREVATLAGRGPEFDLDLPIDRLDHEALAVCRAIRQASAGRFPDLCPSPRFPPPSTRPVPPAG